MKKNYFSFLWLLIVFCLSGSLYASWSTDSCKYNSQPIVDHIMQVRGAPLLDIEGLTTLNVSDFGAVPGVDGLSNYSAIQAAMTSAKNMNGNVRLVFPKGQYEIEPVGNNPCILISGLKNVIIDGQGSSVLVKKPSVNFCRIENSENIIVRNFTIDYDPLPFSQGTIKAVDPNGHWFNVEVDEGYPALDDVFFKQYSPWGMLKDPNIPGKLKDVGSNFILTQDFTGIGGNVYRVSVGPSHFSRARNDVKVGDRWVSISRVATGCQYNNNNQVTFDSITFYAAPTSLFSGTTTSRLIVINCHAKLTGNRLAVNGGGGVILQAARFGPWVEGCVFEGLSDDYSNIYCLPAYVREIIEDKKFRMTHTARMLAGDTLVFFRPQTGEMLAQVRIESVVNDVVTLSQAVTGLNLAPAGTPFDQSGWKIYDHAYNINVSSSYFVFRNNHNSNGRRKGNFIKSSWGLIENNHYEGLSNEAISIENEPDWPEGFWSRNIVIRNNTAIGNRGYPLRIRYLSLYGETGMLMQENIFIENNHMRANSGAAASISNVDGLVISNNVFETPSSGPRAIISNVNIHCMQNNTGEETFQMTNVQYTTGVNPVDYPRSLQLYPNPATSKISIKPEESIQGMFQWYIYDVTGSKINTGQLFARGNEISIDISGLKNGMYLLTMNDGQRIQMLRFLKVQ